VRSILDAYRAPASFRSARRIDPKRFHICAGLRFKLYRNNGLKKLRVLVPGFVRDRLIAGFEHLLGFLEPEVVQ
jgi:hypothetical protein